MKWNTSLVKFNLNLEWLGTINPKVKQTFSISSKHLQLSWLKDNESLVVVMPVHSCHLTRLQGEVPDSLVWVLMDKVGAHKSINLTVVPRISLTGSCWTSWKAGGLTSLAVGNTVCVTGWAWHLAFLVPKHLCRITRKDLQYSGTRYIRLTKNIQ